jgi:sterol desaturase/sphingolipid hydroxylase (fatty acid hydroxylase superfamily)
VDARAIALSIPFFLVLLAIEIVVARAQKRKLVPLHDAVASLSTGIGQQLMELATAAFSLAAYAYIAKHHALMHFTSWWSWVLLILLVDLAYYWFHRASHRVGFLWAIHSVHHQSEEYNLTTALRQPWLEGLVAWPFYVPIAFLGFPLEAFVLALTIDQVYQFWIHTRTIEKLGPIEGLLNTPSAHRVHHGIDPEYVDKNYGGILMIWDRIFGSYIEESHEPTYGTVKPLASFSPLRANVEGWARLASIALKTRRFRDKLAIFFAPPEWLPDDHGGVQTVPVPSQTKFETEVWSDAGSLIVLALAALLTTLLLWNFEHWSRGTAVVVGASVAIAIVANSARKRSG